MISKNKDEIILNDEYVLESEIKENKLELRLKNKTNPLFNYKVIYFKEDLVKIDKIFKYHDTIEKAYAYLKRIILKRNYEISNHTSGKILSLTFNDGLNESIMKFVFEKENNDMNAFSSYFNTIIDNLMNEVKNLTKKNEEIESELKIQKEENKKLNEQHQKELKDIFAELKNIKKNLNKSNQQPQNISNVDNSIIKNKKSQSNGIIKLKESIINTNSINKKITFSNGNEYNGNVNKEGKPHGKGIMNFLKGKIIKYNGDWVSGEMTGIAKRIEYSNGSKYEGQVKNGEKNGEGSLKTKDGETFECNWVKDNKEGKGKQIFKDGSVFYGNWKNNKKEGEGLLISANNRKVKQVFHDGKLVVNKKAKK